MNHCDLLITARWLATADDDNTVYEDAAIALTNGRIAALGERESITANWQAAHHIDRPDGVLIPGLINAHTHAAMTLFRGIADDLPLDQWLQQRIWPIEGEFVSEDMVRDGARLAVAEMIRSGTTCFNDMYFCPDVVGSVALDARMRASVGLIVIDFETFWAASADEYLSKAQSVYDRFAGNPLISVQFAPHSTYAVGAATLQRVKVQADQLDIKIHIHLHETAQEISDYAAQHDKRPLTHLTELGLVDGNLLAVHMTQMTDAEIDAVAKAHMSIVHCPESNMKLASGIAPVAQLIRRGVNVALGTDGAASNNDLDLLTEMRSAALLAKVSSGDATALKAHEVLRMATINGAHALGLGEHTGSLEPGKWADIVCVDLDSAHTQPTYDPVSSLVYCAGRGDVRDVWVAGRGLMSDRQLTTIDEAAVIKRTAEWRQRIQHTLTENNR
ncbi:MAG: TRZ/ATZ family hydrolase [Pseudomonadota bacterium]